MNSIKFNRLENVKIHFVKDYLHVKSGSFLYYPIHYACKHASKEMIQYLIKNECDLEVTDLENKTPIHWACSHGKIETVQVLLDNNCDINSSDYLQRTPIHLACKKKHEDIVELLMKYKCKVEIYDYFNQCPLDIAKKLKLNDMINIIYKRKVVDAMELRCIDFCDHKFCFESVFSGNFNKGKIVGEGSFGKVYHCITSNTERDFALKKVGKVDKIIKYIEGRINDFLEILKHENITKYFGSYNKNKKLFIFMEYFKESLKQTINCRNMNSDNVIHFTKQLLEALDYLHGKNIIHRDIKPANIMLDHQENVKLTDFGHSLELSNIEQQISEIGKFCGTAHYIAPEILHDKMYSFSADIWSLGITAIEIATGKTPYHNLPTYVVMSEIMENKEVEYKILDQRLKLLIQQMLKPKESERASASVLLQYIENQFPNSNLHSNGKRKILNIMPINSKRQRR